MQDSEIKKALECCALCKQHCPSSCPLKDNYNCKKILFKYTLDLINRQQTTIDSFTDIGKLYSEIKIEAYKEFAEFVLSLFPRDKNFTTISRFTVNQKLKELWVSKCS